MTEINCYIDEPITIANKEYYKVKEKDSHSEYLVPAFQFKILKTIEKNSTYPFIKLEQSQTGKPFLSLLNPKYVIGSEHEFEVTSLLKVDTRNYFELKSEYEKPLTVFAKDWQLEYRTINCRVVGYKQGMPVLKNIDLRNTLWEVNDRIEFKIADFGTANDKRGEEFETVVVRIGDKFKHVKCCPWQSKNFWKYSTIFCKVINVDNNGLPNLVVDDDRHPLYATNNIYNFEVVSFREKIISYGRSRVIMIQLKDDLNHFHEVLALQNQENLINKGEKVSCKIEKICTKLYLRQIDANDPFFHSFESIEKDVALKKKYFDSYIHSEEKLDLKLQNQYLSKSAFWVFTYCNLIIPNIKIELVTRKDYKSLLEVIKLHSKIERWILSKGILRALDESERKSVKIKIENILENNLSEIEALTTALELDTEVFLKSQLTSLNFKKLYYLLKYTSLDLINEFDVLKILNQESLISKKDEHFITQIIYIIRSSIRNFKPEGFQDYFILTKTSNPGEELYITKYFNWSHILIKLCNIIKNFKHKNYLIARLYRQSSLYEKEFENRVKLLYNAFFILSNDRLYYDIPIYTIGNKIMIDLSQLEHNPNFAESLDASKEFLLGNVREKHYQGFKINIGHVNGYLPFQNIHDNVLKHSRFKSLDWNINISIKLYSREFNFFVARQLSQSSEHYYSENLFGSHVPSPGSIIFGTVKEVQYFGVFFYTDFGDALLRKQNISYNYVDWDLIPYYFKRGDKLPLYVLDTDGEKLELSFKHIEGSEYSDYYNSFFELYDLDLSTQDKGYLDFDFKIEVEKGFVFEQYAINQTDLDQKIMYLRFAKAFFSNTKNARSYLLNIYIEYFSSLIKLDRLIKEYSFLKYQTFKKEIVHIKDKVLDKTLENYPEAKNLLFFIDILNLFNSKEEGDLEVLFNIIKKPLDEYDSLLKVVAKTVLSNNLIISESSTYSKEELDSYTLKNLNRIRSYILHGVLSLEETVEDRLKIELKQKVLYVRNLINLDEGEKLEFKSTFITPVPDAKKKQIISSLEKKVAIQNDNLNILEINKKIDELKGLTAQKKIMHSALKTIVAFANTGGGTLLLGVSDDKKIFGLEQDYLSFKKENSRDEFGKFFDAKVREYIGPSFSSNFLNTEFLKFPEGDVLVVTVKPSLDEIFLLKDENGLKVESLYVRNLSSSERLEGIELAKFIKNRYRGLIGNIDVELNNKPAELPPSA